ncbi:hypothetical protein AMECASPLE_026716 [Ameca splendens]|uniref:Uncharacterized protein n=1 Tax=Ameca splendens TaxID=208324 RepID=A0ABV0YT62_9TELE
MCRLTPGGCAPGAGPLSGHYLGSDISRGVRSLDSWLDLHRRLPAGPVGSSLQLPGASALWLLGGSPWILSCFPLGGGSLCTVGPLDIYGSDLLRICPRSRGAGLWLLTLAITYFYGETLYTQARSYSDPQEL